MKKHKMNDKKRILVTKVSGDTQYLSSGKVSYSDGQLIITHKDNSKTSLLASSVENLEVCR